MNNVSEVLTKLHEIAMILSRAKDGSSLSVVLQEVATKLPGLFGADHATITLLDDAERFFRVEAEYPPLPPLLVGRRIFIQGRPTQIGLVDLREPVVANDLDGHALVSESPAFREIADALGIRSLLVVPMVADGATLGTISLEMIGRTKCFSKEEVELCQTVASQIVGFVAANRFRNEQQAGVSAREDKVARMLFRDLAKVIQFKKASLQLIVNDKRMLVGAFGFEKSAANPRLLRPVEADPLIREIVHAQKPKILPDTSIAKDWEEQESTADVHSWIGLPLVLKGETIGIVTLDHDQAGFYKGVSKDVLARLDKLTAKAAQDVGEKYRHELAQHQIQALETIRQFAETVATKLDPGDLLEAIVSAITQGLDCTRCSIFLAEQQEGQDLLVCKAACEASSCSIAHLYFPRSGRPPCPVQHAYQLGHSVFIPDLNEDSDFDFTLPLYQDARAVIAEPLKIANQVIGVVLAVHQRPGRFSAAHRVLLETLVRQAASAIERDTGLELVHLISTQIVGATEVKAVLEHVVSGAMKLTYTDSGVIYELENQEDRYRVVHSFKPKGAVHPQPRLDDPGGVTRTVIARKCIVEIPDIEQDDRVSPRLREAGYRSMYAVPLLVDQSVVGVLYINGRSIRNLTKTERSLLGTLADQAALAIQRARLFEQIRDSDALYRSLVGHIPQFVLRKDTNSRVTWASANFCESLGKALPEIIGKNDFDFYPKEDAELYVYRDSEVMESKMPMTFEKEVNRPLGRQSMMVRVVKTPVLDASGEVIGLQVIFWDITKEVEKSESAHRWQALAEQSPDGIVVHESGKITLANPAAVLLFGANSAEELKGRSILDFLDETSRPLAEQQLERLEKGVDVQMAEWCIECGPGDKVDVEAHTRKVTDTDEIQTVFHVVTRAKTLLREMHHRVRGSYNQVAGILVLQEQFGENDPKLLKAFSTLRERIQAMAEVHSILSRTGEESDVDMAEYLDQLRTALILQHGTGDKIAVDFSVERMHLNEEHATECGLIVNELVSNSLRHAFTAEVLRDRRGRVTVSLRADEDNLELAVLDNGIGQKRPMSHANETMGLSLVRSLVADGLNGTIEVTDASPGTRTTITFPTRTLRKDLHNGK